MYPEFKVKLYYVLTNERLEIRNTADFANLFYFPLYSTELYLNHI